MKEILWTAKIKAAPTAGRYCKRCGVKRDFVSSGLFRVNAHQKSLDVWLIYKCPACDATWKLTIYTGIAPHAMPPELLRGFIDNDPGLALRCAADTALLKRYGAEPGLPELDIIGEEVQLQPDEPLRIRLHAEQPTEIKARDALRGKLGLSRSELERWMDSGRLSCVSGQNLTKCRLAGEIVVEITL